MATGSGLYPGEILLLQLNILFINCSGANIFHHPTIPLRLLAGGRLSHSVLKPLMMVLIISPGLSIEESQKTS